MGQSEWEPFEVVDGFTYDWWHRPIDWSGSGGRFEVFADRVGGDEVARVEIDLDTSVEHYAGVEPGLRTRARLVEIEFLEVAASWRGRGIVRGVVGRLAKHYESEGECRLVAFSEGADAFWSSLGWVRYDHAEGPDWHRPLFVAPQG